ncbi:hypothetical protein HYH03_009557 [Edaphochlamys debaryana]|uniref:Uncharacterized protein n=1 Tax=Edaphochlamys debaryana TaxID=47281 RepID=A0A835XYE6_9CHLO|nr:hypothetical protein HYH03_009557 [Edaphochlamys debaryana]|eukprot:KAG2492059.1 hypothetical protein HYH03_009557 [Edaphochlamys debaryana]
MMGRVRYKSRILKPPSAPQAGLAGPTALARTVTEPSTPVREASRAERRLPDGRLAGASYNAASPPPGLYSQNPQRQRLDPAVAAQAGLMAAFVQAGLHLPPAAQHPADGAAPPPAQPTAAQRTQPVAQPPAPPAQPDAPPPGRAQPAAQPEQPPAPQLAPRANASHPQPAQAAAQPPAAAALPPAPPAATPEVAPAEAAALAAQAAPRFSPEQLAYFMTSIVQALATAQWQQQPPPPPHDPSPEPDEEESSGPGTETDSGPESEPEEWFYRRSKGKTAASADLDRFTARLSTWEDAEQPYFDAFREYVGAHMGNSYSEESFRAAVRDLGAAIESEVIALAASLAPLISIIGRTAFNELTRDLHGCFVREFKAAWEKQSRPETKLRGLASFAVSPGLLETLPTAVRDGGPFAQPGIMRTIREETDAPWRDLLDLKVGARRGPACALPTAAELSEAPVPFTFLTQRQAAVLTARSRELAEEDRKVKAQAQAIACFAQPQRAAGSGGEARGRRVAGGSRGEGNQQHTASAGRGGGEGEERLRHHDGEERSRQREREEPPRRSQSEPRPTRPSQELHSSPAFTTFMDTLTKEVRATLADSTSCQNPSSLLEFIKTLKRLAVCAQCTFGGERCREVRQGGACRWQRVPYGQPGEPPVDVLVKRVAQSLKDLPVSVRWD